MKSWSGRVVVLALGGPRRDCLAGTDTLLLLMLTSTVDSMLSSPEFPFVGKHMEMMWKMNPSVDV